MVLPICDYMTTRPDDNVVTICCRPRTATAHSSLLPIYYPQRSPSHVRGARTVTCGRPGRLVRLAAGSRQPPAAPLATVSSSQRQLLDRVHPVGVEREVVLDLAHGIVRVLVAPYRVRAARSGGGDAEVGGVALVWAVGVVVGAHQQAQVGILPRHVVDDRVVR